MIWSPQVGENFLAARQLAGVWYVVFLVHNLAGTETKEKGSRPFSELVQRGPRGTATAAESRQMREHFQVWMACVRDAVITNYRPPGSAARPLPALGSSCISYRKIIFFMTDGCLREAHTPSIKR
jgi:hypothetical protein